VSVTVVPGASVLTRLRSWFESSIADPLTFRITSPDLRPDFAAGPLGSTEFTSAPATEGTPRLFARSDVIGCTVTPMIARRT